MNGKRMTEHPQKGLDTTIHPQPQQAGAHACPIYLTEISGHKLGARSCGSASQSTVLPLCHCQAPLIKFKNHLPAFISVDKVFLLKSLLSSFLITFLIIPPPGQALNTIHILKTFKFREPMTSELYASSTNYLNTLRLIKFR